MHMIAHRGCADQYHENTRTAFERSVAHVDAVEIGVRRCERHHRPMKPLREHPMSEHASRGDES